MPTFILVLYDQRNGVCGVHDVNADSLAAARHTTLPIATGNTATFRYELWANGRRLLAEKLAPPQHV